MTTPSLTRTLFTHLPPQLCQQAADIHCDECSVSFSSCFVCCAASLVLLSELSAPRAEAAVAVARALFKKALRSNFCVFDVSDMIFSRLK